MAKSEERDRLIDDITRAQRDMARVFAQDRSLPILASNLTMQQFKTLLILSMRDDLSGHDLAEALGVKLGTVTGIVDRLVAQDLVERHEDPADRRVRRVRLTSHGRGLVTELTDTGMRKMRDILGEFSTDALRQCAEVMDSFGDAIDRLYPHPSEPSR
ncbi:MAG TPA: MarR family transcriptional regulator [Stackebrandtia sp.]|uniref:MarR family winged helix-turn-helix transcriptional regulator n=1 Tax=Stackebrandtia sp. TaxID=2023065 RepID=UPI002D69A073|nr:MarR family transcriptional regulator [Stackebrandtia sp.]HZE38206.1 MarR family transcriptional regulator [Stackebrandtia sp.]